MKPAGTIQTKTLAAADAQLELTPALLSEIEQLVERCLAEDLGEAGDITTLATVPEDATATAQLWVKQPGVIAGLAVAARIFYKVSPDVEFEPLVEDGTEITETPFLCARIKGSARGLLTAERTALNVIQRISGIATLTNKFVKAAAGSGVAILDTRKTTPGLRAIERFAVRAGGGTNHRFGLFDAILIKDNHISIAGGVTQAIAAARKAYPQLPVEVEVCDFNELQEALDSKAERIMLDNMSPDMVKDAVTRVNGRSFIEVSGGITFDTISNYLIPGVNAISIGALTHSVKSLDISLEIETSNRGATK